MLLFFLLLIIIAILTLQIKISIIDFKLKNFDGLNINVDAKLIIELYIYKFIKIGKIVLTKEKMVKTVKKLKIDVKKYEQNYKITQLIKKLKFKVTKLDFRLKIGLGGVTPTIYGVTVISSILPVLLKDNFKNKSYEIIPLYNQKIQIDLKGDIIISVYLTELMRGFKRNISQ